MVKDKNKPKGPMSAYACFVQVIREEHKKKHPEESVVFSEFSKKCAEKWKTMTDKEKQRFDDMASRDKERYIREMDTYIPPDGIKKPRKRRRNKDPGQPKRALSAFFFFCEEKRPAVRAEHPDWKVGDIAKELGRQWELCQCKGKYESQAMADKSRYEREMIEYRNGTFTITKRARMEDVISGETVGLTAAGNGYQMKQDTPITMYNMNATQPQSHLKPDISSSDVPAFENQLKPELPVSGSSYNMTNSSDAVPHPAAFGHPNFNTTSQPAQQTPQPSVVAMQPHVFTGMLPQDLTAPSQSQLQSNAVSETQHQPNQTRASVSHDIPVMQHRVTPGGDTVDMTAEQNGGSVAEGITHELNDPSHDGTNAADEEEDEDDDEEDDADE